MRKAKEQSIEITVQAIKTGKINFCILGTTPFIFNAMSQKSKEILLYPKGRKTEADKAGTLKHDPLEEYRNSVYSHRDNSHPTRLYFPGAGFKKSMANAALDIPGVAKSKIGRLVWVDEYNMDVYGIPQMLMSVTRSADINRTPDIRTRAILPQWACHVSATYVRPALNDQAIANLAAAAGLLSGLGDWRQEKGSANYGQFELVTPDDPRFKAVQKTGGRAAQDKALEDPAMFDLETERLYSWFNEERTRRMGKPKLVIDNKRSRKEVA